MKPTLPENKTKWTRNQVQRLIDDAYFAGADDSSKECFENMPNELIIETVFLAIEKGLNISKDDMAVKTRKKPIIDARKIFYWYVYPHVRSLNKLGDMFNLAHPTVHHAIRTFRDHYRSDPDFRFSALKVQRFLTKKRESN